MQEEPLYPFGYGLSYTKFTYDDLQLSDQFIKKGESVKVSFSLKNKGKVSAEEVVQLYIKRENDSIATPLFSLKGFKRVAVKAGETIPISFTITPEMMSIVNNDGKNLLESGTVTVFVGGALPGQRSLDLGMSKGMKGEFEIQ
jgi:beta-glucosidase